MNINVEKTRQYYKEYKECRCTDCINFYKVFPQMYPKICEYLLLIGIDPTKPLELCSIYNQKEDRMEYLICMYVGIGKVEDDFEIEIEGLEISVNRNHHPILETNEEAFVIDFGPVYIKQTNLYNRHLTKEERIKVINNVLIKHDPIGLIKLGSPLDEYMQEAKLIESIMENKDVFQKNSSFIISRIFNDQFGEEVPIKVIKKNQPIENPNELDECNGVSLNEARKNYIRFGYSKKRDRLWVRKPRKNEMFCNRYIHEYINLLGLYTNIGISKKDITKEVKKGIKGKFNNLYDCVTYLNYSKEYAIRFNDDMKAEEFDDVFETLIKDLGDPDLFNEWEGYIWKRRGYVIALGLVSLNYNYEVPMICVKRRTSIFNSNLDYKKYIEIANSIREPLINRRVNPQRMTYYKIGYFKEFGFSVHIRTLSKFISINYKKSKLSINVTPVVHELNNEIIKNQDRFNKEIKVNNDFELKSKLEELLEETKEYHGL